MAKFRKFYEVNVKGIKTDVKSLAEVKKLIRGQSDWKVTHFEVKSDMKVIAMAWKELYDIHRSYNFKHLFSSYDKLCLALYKSRAAK